MFSRFVSTAALAVAFSCIAPAVARAAAPTFQRGVNVSHWLAQNSPDRPYGADWFGEEDIQWIAAAGFDHVRIPVDGREWVLPGSVLDAPKIAPFDRALAWARQHGLGVVLDMHFLPGTSSDPESDEDNSLFTNSNLQMRVAEFWRRIARRYANADAGLRFEILNEPTAPDVVSLNKFHARMLAAIRETNPRRVVYLDVPRWNDATSFDGFAVPDDPHVAITIHFYQPMKFTHQRAAWVGFAPEMPPVPFPAEASADPEITAAFVESRLAAAATWAAGRSPRRELYLAEIGVFVAADADSTRRYLRVVRDAAKKHGLGWAVWDYQGGFAVRDAEGNATAVLEGLMK